MMKNALAALMTSAAMLFGFAPVFAEEAPATEPPGSATLKDAFEGCFLVGTAMNRWFIMDEVPGVLDFAASQFNAVTAENAMKWGRINPAKGDYHFDIADALVDYAEANDMKVIGHTLVWHSQTPDWVFENWRGRPVDRDVLLARLEQHMEKVAGRYAGRIHGWDVLNEAILDDGSWRDSPWRRILGEDYVATVFEMAHEADPQADLYYNDYNMYLPGKRDAVVAMVKDLQQRGVPIHGIGMQGHFGIDRPSMEDFTAALDAYGALGLKVMITEMDVTVLPWPEKLAVGADISTAADNRAELDPYTDGLPADIAAAQAEQYAAFFRELVARREFVSRVTFWGVSDADNWKNNFPVRGRTDHPMLFDRDLQPKPAYDAVMAQAAPCARE